MMIMISPNEPEEILLQYKYNIIFVETNRSKLKGSPCDAGGLVFSKVSTQ